MGNKGIQTKQMIKMKAYELFAKRGFKSITMKDVCEVTGLSRGGLYQHYDNTRQIFEDLFLDMSSSQENDFFNKMEAGVPATEILGEILERLRVEMIDSKNSLSLAIFEFTDVCDSIFFVSLNEKGIKKWSDLIHYGVERKEFKEVNVEQTVDVILYSYQGVRMWSRVCPLEDRVANHIVSHIKEILGCEDETSS